METYISSVTQTPYIIDDQGEYKAETLLTVCSRTAVDKAWVKITVPGRKAAVEAIGGIAPGCSTQTVRVPELEKEGDEVTFALFDNAACAGAALASLTGPQKKVRHWTVYVSHSTHMDIGYTDYQEYLRDTKWPAHLDEAFEFIEATDAWPEAEKFRHHIESSYMLYGSALNVRDAEWLEHLREQLAQGRLAYSASCMNNSLEVMGAEELVRYYYYSQRLMKDMLGVDSSGIAMMVDNPSISWAAIDVMAGAGVKYMYLGPNFNYKTPLTVTEGYPRLFYLAGRNPANRVLLISGNLYNLDEMQFVDDGPNPDPVSLETTIKCTGDVLMNVYHKDNYPGDVVLQMVDQYRDNGKLFAQVMERVREMNQRTDPQGRPYVYPKFVNSNMKDFCEDVAAKHGAEIPTFTGTYENWWCFGTPSDAYASAEIRYAHDSLPQAEMLAALASVAGEHCQYPIGAIADAYNYMMLYDEHTFGPSQPVVGDQHIWKRNTAIACKRLTDAVAGQAVRQLTALIPAAGQTIVVYNTLSWARSGIVRVALAQLPPCFAITDLATGAAVKYEKQDGCALFCAAQVPGMGYKGFAIQARAAEPVFAAGLTVGPNYLENAFYRVTVDNCGEIVSILDKQNGDRELVDTDADCGMNEFRYVTSALHGHAADAVHRAGNVSFAIEAGPVQGRITAQGFCEGTAGIERTIVLYADLPKIDFINTVKKNDALAWRKQDEEGFFTFPLRVPEFVLRHEMPTGDVRPGVDPRHMDPNAQGGEIEQFYTSSTDFYTANRWIDASSPTENYGVTLSCLSTPIIQYGERRSMLYDIDYRPAKPWVYSYALNNKWGTNFMKTQPGPVTFRYTLQAHAGGDWREGRADHFGWETSAQLLPQIIPEAQAGAGQSPNQGQWLTIDADNVVLTAMKPAEANGEGLVLRFNETLGRATTATVDLAWFAPTSVLATDLVENDLAALPVENGCIRLTLDAYGWQTVRVTFGSAPAPVTGVQAITGAAGTLITWDAAADCQPGFYEIFRNSQAGFTPGAGDYVASTTTCSFYDRQVTSGLTKPYAYVVRAVKCGLKGAPSPAVMATGGEILEQTPPSAPTALRVDYAQGNRVSLSWLPATSGIGVKGYRLERDGVCIADLAAILNSYLDIDVHPDRTYTYTVQAYDWRDGLSAASAAVTVTPAKGDIKPGNIAPCATIQASSQYSDAYPATAVADGFVGITGEWRSAGEATPWLTLAWEKAHTINRVVLHARDSEENFIRRAGLHFSDGSTIDLSSLPTDGSAVEVAFPAKTVDGVKFQVLSAKGWNVGLAEIEVFTV